MENTVIWTKVPGVQLPSLEDAMTKLRVDEDDADDFAEIYGQCKAVMDPKFLLRTAEVEPCGEETCVIGGVEFESRMVAVNLKDVHTVYAYCCTCGRELFDLAVKQSDPLCRYWVDQLSELALRSMTAACHQRLKELTGAKKLHAMNPGSLPDWPITQQQPLFCLLGDTEGLIGVTLSESCLMTPYKSGSGILYSSEQEFVSCEHCKKLDCPNRRKAYDPEAFAKRYGKEMQ